MVPEAATVHEPLDVGRTWAGAVKPLSTNLETKLVRERLKALYGLAAPRFERCLVRVLSGFGLLSS